MDTKPFDDNFQILWRVVNTQGESIEDLKNILRLVIRAINEQDQILKDQQKIIRNLALHIEELEKSVKAQAPTKGFAE